MKGKLCLYKPDGNLVGYYHIFDMRRTAEDLMREWIKKPDLDRAVAMKFVTRGKYYAYRFVAGEWKLHIERPAAPLEKI